MLVLSRKPGERIIIGDHIELTVVEIRGNRIRLGIKAPPETPILRAEVQQRMQQQDIPQHDEGQYDSASKTDEPCWAA